jgi:hypothetical protein
MPITRLSLNQTKSGYRREDESSFSTNGLLPGPTFGFRVYEKAQVTF